MKDKKEIIIPVLAGATIAGIASFLYQKKKAGKLKSLLKKYRANLIKENNELMDCREEIGTFDESTRNYIPLQLSKKQK